jgi:hypothetical protein
VVNPALGCGFAALGNPWSKSSRKDDATLFRHEQAVGFFGR